MPASTTETPRKIAPPDPEGDTMHPNLEYSLARTLIQDRLDDARMAERARDAETTASTPRPTRLRWVAVASVTLTIAAGAGAALASSGLEDRGRPTDAAASPAGPIVFDDPAVVKGARGGKKNTVTVPFFGDPAVRKGAGGQR